jgi:carbon-monoxide dehydrogenase small subunit
MDERSSGTEPPAARVVATVNGEPVEAELPPSELLLDFLRSRLDLRGAKRSCDVQMCGTCTVLVDNRPVSACCYLAVDVDGREVWTVEGLANAPGPAGALYQAIEDAFVEHAAVQCGFCTPGFVTTLHHLISTRRLDHTSTEPEVRELLRGNLCRCTGYEPILRSALSVLEAGG